ncbi:IPT/TIG domain-containing protein [Hymenobacter sp. BT662]|uniref:IPT/TIG domain-containing protein n=2 Tax=Hymenobacter ruricola TaxID=2791023 RepID=A0ABS0I0Q6_9BACT|nr:IPT/TIG domain-containing protein [Hymenobacter ruricola]
MVKSQGREGGQAQIFSEDYPQITAIQPASGPVGTVVTLTGKNFNPSIAGNRLLFWSSVPVAPTAASSTSLQVVVPAGAKTGPLYLYKYVKGEFGQADAEYVSQSSPVDFTVTP